MLQRNARFSILQAVAAATAMALIQPYVKKFAIEMGATNLQLGYLSSWPNLVSVIGVLGVAAAVARSRSKQRLIAAIFLIGRCAALGAAAVPWFPEQYRIWCLIGFWVLAVVPNAAGGSALQSFLADVFPGNERAKQFASRQSWSTIAASSVGLVSGLALDNWIGYPIGYQIMFVLSFAVALAEIFFFLQLKEADEPGQSSAQPRSGLAAYMDVFRHRPYLLFLLCSVPFHFTWQMAWPIFDRYQVSFMHTNNTWMQLITVANSSGAFFAYPAWARLADKVGNRKAMAVAAMILATAPFLTSLAPSMEWLALVNLFTGIGVAGVMLLILNNMLEVSPSEGRPVYLAVHMALVSVTGTIAPMVGAFLLERFEIHTALAICTAFRFLTGSSFFWMGLIGRNRKGNAAATENESSGSPA